MEEETLSKTSASSTSSSSSSSSSLVPQSPLILRCFRLMEAFAKSDDERDFFLDRLEGAIFYIDLERPQEDLDGLHEAMTQDPERYCLIPKLTFYETKKIMEGFVNEKIYDIDTKEKLLDIISVKGAREHFIEFLHDHLSEQEKWMQYYQERSRIRIIEWLRKHHFQFVFEEDVELDRALLEKVKTTFFHKKIAKDIETARKTLMTKAKTYYSNEALNPRPKRGRPPKQVVKQETEPQVSADIYTTVPKAMSPFLFTPSVGQSWAATFSSKFEEESSWCLSKPSTINISESDDLTQKLAALRQLARNSGVIAEEQQTLFTDEDWGLEDDDEEDDFDEDVSGGRTSKVPGKTPGAMSGGTSSGSASSKKTSSSKAKEKEREKEKAKEKSKERDTAKNASSTSSSPSTSSTSSKIIANTVSSVAPSHVSPNIPSPKAPVLPKTTSSSSHSPQSQQPQSAAKKGSPLARPANVKKRVP